MFDVIQLPMIIELEEVSQGQVDVITNNMYNQRCRIETFTLKEKCFEIIDRE